jgi:hypothetical protein
VELSENANSPKGSTDVRRASSRIARPDDGQMRHKS